MNAEKIPAPERGPTQPQPASTKHFGESFRAMQECRFLTSQRLAFATGVSERTVGRYRSIRRFDGESSTLLRMLRFMHAEQALSTHEIDAMRLAIGPAVNLINKPHPIEQQINAVGMPTPSAPGNYDAELAVLTDKLVVLYGREQAKGMLIGLLVSSSALMAQPSVGQQSVGRASPPASLTPTPPTPPPQPPQPPQPDTIIPQMLSAKISKGDDGKKHIVRVYGAGKKKP